MKKSWSGFFPRVKMFKHDADTETNHVSGYNADTHPRVTSPFTIKIKPNTRVTTRVLHAWILRNPSCSALNPRTTRHPRAKGRLRGFCRVLAIHNYLQSYNDS